MADEATIRIYLRNELGEVVHTWIPPQDTFSFTRDGWLSQEASVNGAPEFLYDISVYATSGDFSVGQTIMMRGVYWGYPPTYLQKEFMMSFQTPYPEYQWVWWEDPKPSRGLGKVLDNHPPEAEDGLQGYQIRWGAWSGIDQNTWLPWTSLFNRPHTVYLSEDGVNTVMPNWYLSASLLTDPDVENPELPIEGTAGITL